MYLQWYDYIIFVGMLILSTIIGLYFGYSGRNASKTDYLLGGRNMKILPVGFSLAASIISSTGLIVLPVDVYYHGNHTAISMCFIAIILFFIYFATFPIFYNLQLTSIYEYIGLRFNKHVHFVLSILYLISLMIFCPVYIYLPALSLSQGTGLSLHYISLIICIVCIFYTTIGGLKAVVWTDTLQFSIFIATLVIITVISTVKIGFWKIIETSAAGDRLNIDFDFDLMKRDTFWAVLFGGSFFWFNNLAVNQACIQKSLALPTMAHVKMSFLIFGAIVICTLGLMLYIGHLIYVEFKDCDPLTSKQIQHTDQIVPYFILQTTMDVPGIAGLYIAGLFSAGISSLSSGLNAFSCTVYNDIFKYFWTETVLEKRSRILLNLTTLASGILTIIMVFVLEKMDNIFSVILTVTPLTVSPLIGIYLLGMFSVTGNSKGVIAGVISSMVSLSGLLWGRLYYSSRGFFKNTGLPVSTKGCHNYNETSHFNITANQLTLETAELKPFLLFGISEYYFIAVGVIVFLVVGWIVSWLTKDTDHAVNRDLISPIMHRFLPANENLEYTMVRTGMEN